MNEIYFKWLCDFVCNDVQVVKLSYKKLLRHLYNTDFTYYISNDTNREEDGLNLRYRFENDHGVSLFDMKRSCSVLEMMIALSIRCEEDIMEDSDIGDRTAQWFWNMIASLGLSSMSDEKYNVKIVDKKLRIFLNRKYEKNGKGGLFTVEDCERDLRSIEIWYQMCLYLNSIE